MLAPGGKLGRDGVGSGNDVGGGELGGDGVGGGGGNDGGGKICVLDMDGSKSNTCFKLSLCALSS